MQRGNGMIVSTSILFQIFHSLDGFCPWCCISTCTWLVQMQNTSGIQLGKNPFNQRNCLASRHDSHQRSMMHFFCVNSKIHVLETLCIGSFRVDILQKVYCHLDTKKKEIKGSSNYCIIFIDVIKRRKVRLPLRLNMKTNSKWSSKYIIHIISNFIR